MTKKLPANDGRTDDMDLEIGRRLREVRRQAGVSQLELGQLMKLSAHQLQRYEQGDERMSAVTLIQMASSLRVSVASLLPAVDGQSTEFANEPMLADPDQLLAAFGKIRSDQLKRALVEMAQLMAEQCASPSA